MGQSREKLLGLAAWMLGDLVLLDKVDPPLDNESDHLQIRQEPK